VLAVPRGGPLPTDVTLHASSSQSAYGPEKGMDGSADSFWVSGEGPRESTPQWLDVRFGNAVKADRIVITPRPGYGPKHGRVEALVDGERRELATFTMTANAGATIPFEATESAAFRILVLDAWDPQSGPARNVQIAEIELFAGGDALVHLPKAPGGIAHLDQKAYFNYPGGFTGTEAWHLLQDSPGPAVCAPEDVVDLTESMDASGRLQWEAPVGSWDILRFGYTSTGAHVSTHSQNAGGLAIDYLDRATLDAYWSKVLDPILKRQSPTSGNRCASCTPIRGSWAP
jgi:hypothetical protein